MKNSLGMLNNMTNLLIKIKYLAFMVIFFTLNPGKFFRLVKNHLKAKKIVIGKRNGNFYVSVIIVTHNALDYVKKCLHSLNKFKSENVEIIVVDNASNEETVNFLNSQKELGKIDKLHLSKENTYFAGGNNIGAKLASDRSTHFLLLNSDTEIKNAQWLDAMLSNVPDRGIISFGKTSIPVVRPDGWCFLIDKKTYEEFGGINEYYKMNWGITELAGKVGNKGYGVKSILNPEKYVVHYGQKSYMSASSTAKFNRMSNNEVVKLFKNVKVNLYKI